MIYGSTKTKLDYILDHGFRRIDSAIEKVIAKYPELEPPNKYKSEAKEVSDKVSLAEAFRQQRLGLAAAPGMGLAGIGGQQGIAEQNFNPFMTGVWI